MGFDSVQHKNNGSQDVEYKCVGEMPVKAEFDHISPQSESSRGLHKGGQDPPADDGVKGGERDAGDKKLVGGIFGCRHYTDIALSTRQDEVAQAHTYHAMKHRSKTRSRMREGMKNKS